MNIQERDETKQEALNILLEEIYLYLRYGDIEKALDALDEAIDENKHHYEYLVEKIKLLYMLYLKEEAYEVLDANVELLYSNLDKIDVDFISRRIYYHFYRNTELNTTSTSGNFDYLKITKEFINKYGFSEQEKQETSLREKLNDSKVSTSNFSDNEALPEDFVDTNYNLFGEDLSLEDDFDERNATQSSFVDTTIISEDLVSVDEANIFEDSFLKEVSEELSMVTDEENSLLDEVSDKSEQKLADGISEETTGEFVSENPRDFEQEPIIETTAERETEFLSEELDEPEQEAITEFLEETESEIEMPEELENEALAEENPETVFVEEVVTEQEATEEEDIIIEDNPHIDIPIYLGKVDGKDVFFESMTDHVAPPKEEKPIIIIDSSHYTLTRLVALLLLGFIIGATIVYYL